MENKKSNEPVELSAHGIDIDSDLDDFEPLSVPNISVATNAGRYICDKCSKIFQLERSLRQHHCKIKTNSYACDKCHSTFKYKRNRDYHCRRNDCLNSASGNKLYKLCLFPQCEKRFFHIARMMEHIHLDHGTEVTTERLTFESKTDFMNWKENEEAIKCCYFSIQNGTVSNNNGKYTRYICQRDGSESAHRKRGEQPRLTSRRVKKGTIKTGWMCPARMFCHDQDGKISVVYISSHNHRLTFAGVKHHPLSETTKSFIKHRIALGVPAKQIQQDLRGNIGDRERRDDANRARKEHFVSYRNISEMKRKHKDNTRLHSDDAKSLFLLTEKLKHEAFNPVLLYKPQFADVVIGNSDINALPNSNSLFLIGLQTKQQLEMMKSGASKIVCIDATHCTNKYKFDLVNIVVPDEYGCGYPVAHFITNRHDEQTIHFMISAIKERAPEMMVNAVMSDDDNTGWNAFRGVFGDDIKHLLCKWHVHRSWKRKLQQTVSKDILEEVYHTLAMLMEERDKDRFQTFCKAFIQKYESKCDKFVSYFKEYYLNRPEVWAMCYRDFPHGSTDTNMYVESFHNKLKTFYLNRRPNKRLDDLVNLLLKIEEDTYINHEKKLKYKETPSKKENRHQRGVRIPDAEMEQVAEDKWHLVSQANTDVIYTVCEVTSECTADLCFTKCLELSCLGLCSHLYTCTCKDVARLCKHIHKVQSMRQRGISITLKPEFQNETNDHEVEPRCGDSLKFVTEPVDKIEEHTSVQQKMRNNTILDIEKIRQYLCEGNAINEQLLPHISSTIKQLVQQIEATNAIAQDVTEMVEEEHFQSNEKLKLQLKKMKPTTSFIGRPTCTVKRPAVQDYVQIEKKLLCQDSNLETDNILSEHPESHQFSETCTETHRDLHDQSNHSEPQIKRVRKLQLPKTKKLVDDVKRSTLNQVEMIVSNNTDKVQLRNYHLKSIEDDLSNVDAALIQKHIPDFHRGWLYDSVIDAFLIRITGISDKYLFAPCVCVTALLMNPGHTQMARIASKAVSNMEAAKAHSRMWAYTDFGKIELIFFPYNVGGTHWTLFVADCKLGTITFYDPMRVASAPTDTKIVMQIVNLLCLKLKTQPDHWRLFFSANHPTQLDSISCGVFICYYASCIIKGEAMVETLDHHDYRKFIYGTIVRKCLQRLHKCAFSTECVVCQNKNANTESEWVMCRDCKQWYHCKCAHVEFAAVSRRNFIFICGN